MITLKQPSIGNKNRPLVLILFLLGCSSMESAPTGEKQISSGRPASIVKKLEIRSRTDAFGGMNFGEVGPYEYISAVATIRTDPSHPSNQNIADISLASPKVDGWVEYSVDVGILRPKNPDNAKRVLIYDVVNRGRRTAHTTYLNEGDALDKSTGAGRGFLMNQGYTVVWSGWQGDIPLGQGGLFGTSFPLAKLHDGQSIEGLSREEIIFDHNNNPSEAKLSYPAVSEPSQKASLRVKQRQEDKWKDVTSWKWKDSKTIEIDRPKEMDAGAIYEFTYLARDPLVMGLGFASVRDLVSYLQYDEKDESGQPNPLRDIKKAHCENKDCDIVNSATFEVVVAFGVSQAARFIRDFLWQDFNLDGKNRKIFNGAMPVVGGGRKAWINERFAQPGRWSREHEDHFQPGDQFPFSYAVIKDPVSGQEDGIFKKCEKSNSCPKLMHIDGSYEFWHGRASLIKHDGVAKEIPFPENVRAYLLSSTSHVYFIPKKYETPERCLMPPNKTQPPSLVRALLKNLVDWVATGRTPPESRWPSLANKDLVLPPAFTKSQLKDLRQNGLLFSPTYNSLALTDYSIVPPAADLRKKYRILVPAVDKDGNDIAGIKSPDVSVPLGTHLPWNPRKKGFAEGAACGGYGSFIPFAVSKKDRLARKDTRLSLKERYKDGSNFVSLVKKESEELQKQRLLLSEDYDWWKQWAEQQKSVIQD